LRWPLVGGDQPNEAGQQQLQRAPKSTILFVVFGFCLFYSSELSFGIIEGLALGEFNSVKASWRFNGSSGSQE
jgi:hypothetical protein